MAQPTYRAVPLLPPMTIAAPRRSSSNPSHSLMFQLPLSLVRSSINSASRWHIHQEGFPLSSFRSLYFGSNPSLYNKPLRRQQHTRPPISCVTKTPTISSTSSSSTSSKESKLFRLAPSDFAFLYQECKRCFYLKAHKRLYRPRAPFPTIFSTIDTEMKAHFRGLETRDILPTLPEGRFLCEEKDAWVESLPIRIPGFEEGLYIRGMLDCLIGMDETDFGIVDFKTSSIRGTDVYSRQLHAYGYAIENPSENSELIEGRVKSLGLLVYQPNKFLTPRKNENDTGDDSWRNRMGSAALMGKLEYVEIERNDDMFLGFMKDVLELLTRDEAPDPPPAARNSWTSTYSSCSYCQFLHDAEKKNLIP